MPIGRLLWIALAAALAVVVAGCAHNEDPTMIMDEMIGNAEHALQAEDVPAAGNSVDVHEPAAEGGGAPETQPTGTLIEQPPEQPADPADQP